MTPEQKKTIKQWSELLISRMKTIDIMYDHILAGLLCKDKELDRILSATDNEEEQKEHFLDLLLNHPHVNIFPAFIKVLLETQQKDLADRLTGCTSCKTSFCSRDTNRPFIPLSSHQSQNLTPSSLGHDSVEGRLPTLNTGNTSTVERAPVQVSSDDGPHSHLPHFMLQSKRTSKPKFYDMKSRKYKGHALIINNYEFDVEWLKYRRGAKEDSASLRNLFEYIGFRYAEENNLTAQEMETRIQQFATSERSKNSSSLIVVILTHGSVTGLYGRDGHEMSTFKGVIQPFSRDQAPQLADIPKLFLFQSCRGDREDTLPLNLPDINNEQENIASAEKQPQNPNANKRRAAFYPNMLIVHSTIPGFVAWRNKEEGSWFIQAFCQVVKENAKDEHMLDMIVEVQRVLSDREEDEALQQIHPEVFTDHKWFLFPEQ